MTTIDWDGMPHAEMTEQLSRGCAVRDQRVKDLLGIGTQPSAAVDKRGPGRPKGPRIVLGNEAPRGDLDNEGEGDEALQ